MVQIQKTAIMNTEEVLIAGGTEVTTAEATSTTGGHPRPVAEDPTMIEIAPTMKSAGDPSAETEAEHQTQNARLVVASPAKRS